LEKLVLKQCKGFAKDLTNFDTVLHIFIETAQTNPPTTNTETNFSSKNQPTDHPKQTDRLWGTKLSWNHPTFYCLVCSLLAVYVACGR